MVTTFLYWSGFAKALLCYTDNCSCHVFPVKTLWRRVGPGLHFYCPVIAFRCKCAWVYCITWYDLCYLYCTECLTNNGRRLERCAMLVIEHIHEQLKCILLDFCFPIYNIPNQNYYFLIYLLEGQRPKSNVEEMKIMVL